MNQNIFKKKSRDPEQKLSIFTRLQSNEENKDQKTPKFTNRNSKVSIFSESSNISPGGNVKARMPYDIQRDDSPMHSKSMGIIPKFDQKRQSFIQDQDESDSSYDLDSNSEDLFDETIKRMKTTKKIVHKKNSFDNFRQIQPHTSQDHFSLFEEKQINEIPPAAENEIFINSDKESKATDPDLTENQTIIKNVERNAKIFQLLYRCYNMIQKQQNRNGICCDNCFHRDYSNLCNYIANRLKLKILVKSAQNFSICFQFCLSFSKLKPSEFLICLIFGASKLFEQKGLSISNNTIKQDEVVKVIENENMQFWVVQDLIQATLVVCSLDVVSQDIPQVYKVMMILLGIQQVLIESYKNFMYGLVLAAQLMQCYREVDQIGELPITFLRGYMLDLIILIGLTKIWETYLKDQDNLIIKGACDSHRNSSRELSVEQLNEQPIAISSSDHLNKGVNLSLSSQSLSSCSSQSQKKINKVPNVRRHQTSVERSQFHKDFVKKSDSQQYQQEESLGEMEISKRLFNYLNKNAFICGIQNRVLKPKNSLKQDFGIDILTHESNDKNIEIQNGNITVNILQMTSDFLKDIPVFDNVPILTKSASASRKKFQSGNTMKNLIDSSALNSDSFSISRKYSSKSIDLDQGFKMNTLLKMQVFEPYFISNTTILQYEKQDFEKKLSLLEIIETFFLTKKSQTKLYFKIFAASIKKSATLVSDQSSEQQEDSPCKKKEEALDQHYQNNTSNNEEGDSQTQYFEIELKQIIQEESKILRPRKNVTEFNVYDIPPKMHIVIVRDISNIIKSQQKLSDDMYQDAIEQNYSHEQMTPLNIILANSKIVIKRFKEIQKYLEDQDNAQDLSIRNKETVKIIQAIEQSGQGMWYYNQNQIQRMKIQKNEFKLKVSTTKNLESCIMKVIYPFQRQITRQEIKMYITKKYKDNISIKADWLSYQLILFNIIQNSVKYNKFKGEIFVIINCLPLVRKRKKPELESENQYILETEIVDTGIGISKNRQKMLFIPFLELKMKQNLKQVKDHNIGIGLACSDSISKACSGDITIKKSRRGLTVFAFKIPVQVQFLEEVKSASGPMEQEYKMANLNPSDFPEMLLKFLHNQNVESFKKLEIEAEKDQEESKVDQTQINMQAMQNQLRRKKNKRKQMKSGKDLNFSHMLENQTHKVQCGQSFGELNSLLSPFRVAKNESDSQNGSSNQQSNPSFQQPKCKVSSLGVIQNAENKKIGFDEQIEQKEQESFEYSEQSPHMALPNVLQSENSLQNSSGDQEIQIDSEAPVAPLLDPPLEQLKYKQAVQKHQLMGKPFRGDLSGPSKLDLAHNLLLLNCRDDLFKYMRRHNSAELLPLNDSFSANSSEHEDIDVNMSPRDLNISLYSDEESSSLEEQKQEIQEEQKVQCKSIQDKGRMVNIPEEVQESEYDEEEEDQVCQMKQCECKARILVVDDTDFNILAVKLMIKENFMLDIEEAPNGKVGLEMFKEGYERLCGCEDRTYKLIFMDLQMPVMGGIESAKRMQEMINQDMKDKKSFILSKRMSLRLQDLKGKLNYLSGGSKADCEPMSYIVALTSFTNEKTKQDCFNVGIVDVINKPLNYKALHKIMWYYFFRIAPEEYRDLYKQAFDKSLSRSRSLRV